MKLPVAVILFYLATPLSLHADAGIPPDVERFMDIADTCLHFAGEWDSSLPKAQQRDIERKANMYCTRAKKQYRALLARYKDAPEIVKRLHEFEDVNSVSDQSAALNNGVNPWQQTIAGGKRLHPGL